MVCVCGGGGGGSKVTGVNKIYRKSALSRKRVEVYIPKSGCHIQYFIACLPTTYSPSITGKYKLINYGCDLLNFSTLVVQLLEV